jgi:hypothetical protein
VQGRSGSRWLAELGCRGASNLHTNSVVVTLATPDFSMPYIVCALSSSLLAIYAGLVITALTERRRSTAQRLLSKRGKHARTVKLVLVIMAFLVLVPYLDSEWRDWLEEQLAALGLQLW